MRWIKIASWIKSLLAAFIIRFEMKLSLSVRLKKIEYRVRVHLCVFWMENYNDDHVCSLELMQLAILTLDSSIDRMHLTFIIIIIISHITFSFDTLHRMTEMDQYIKHVNMISERVSEIFIINWNRWQGWG